MLTRVVLQNIAIIEGLSFTLEPGFTAITGETGSGKSLILDAIWRVFDKKNSPKNLLRHQAERGVVELTFHLGRLRQKSAVLAILESSGVTLFPQEEEIVLSREITPAGSRCRVNGALVPVDTMDKLGELLLEIYGQHDLHHLFSNAKQRDLLDNMGGVPLLEIKKQVRETYRQISQLQQTLQEQQQRQADRLRQLDFLDYQIAEIRAAEIADPQEDERIKAERDRLAHAEQLIRQLEQACQYLTDDPDFETQSAASLVAKAQKPLNQAVQVDASLEPIYEQVALVEESLKSIRETIRAYQAQIDLSPERIQTLVERLDVLEKLKRKYGGSLETVISTCEKYEAELTELQQLEDRFSHLESDLQAAQAQYTMLANALTDLRQKTAAHLQQAISNELAALMLDKAQFEISLPPSDISESGQEAVVFLFSANPGEPLKPLAQVASGGELSRLMLALKIQTAHADGIGTLILDEIDTGISGMTVRAIAEKLLALGQQCQILAVTHQPIVAAKAPNQVHVQKQMLPNDVVVTAMPLTDKRQRQTVLAQLTAGQAGLDDATQAMLEQLLA